MENLLYEKPRSRRVQVLTLAALLISFAGWGVVVDQNSRNVQSDMRRIVTRYQEGEEVLNDIQTETLKTAILMRDELLAQGQDNSSREEILDLGHSVENQLDLLESRSELTQGPIMDRLRQEVRQYQQSVISRLDAATSGGTSGFLRQTVVPYRERVLSVASDTKSLIAANVDKQQKVLEDLEARYRSTFRLTMAAVLFFGITIVFVSTRTMATLERRNSDLQRRTIEDREELRELSRRLLRAQEEERRSISRELHDQVGQTLTATRMELDNLSHLRNNPSGFDEHLTAAKTLAEETLNAVRDLAMGLRPSILDDLGLAPALEWQARQFTRQTGVPVSLQIDGNVDRLNEGTSTCLYRIVQESLTNCARHSNASEVRIVLHGTSEQTFLTVQDNGRGFIRSESGKRGMGLVGIEERGRELGGAVRVSSEPGKGTVLQVELPFDEGDNDDKDSRSRG